MAKSAVYYKRGEKNRGQPRSFEGHRGVFMGYRVHLEKNATDRVFLLKNKIDFCFIRKRILDTFVV